MGDYTAPALLIAVALYLAWNASQTRNWRARIATLVERSSVARVYVGWAMGAWIGLALPAMFGMILLGRDPFATPPEFHRDAFVTGIPLAEVLVASMLLGTVLNLWIALRRRRLGNGPARVLVFPLPKPMRLAETPPPALLALSTGISEELFFRQFLPLLIVLVSGSLPLALLLAAAAYASVYRYRGLRGMIGTAVIGLALSGVYLFSGSLVTAMFVQVVVLFNRRVIDAIAFWPRRTAPG